MVITSTPHSFGHEIFKDGIFKLALVTTYSHTGYDLGGKATHTALPRKKWDIHFCSPHMNIEEMRGVLDCVDKLPLHGE